MFRLPLRPTLPTLAGVLCGLGFALLVVRNLLAGALGLECLWAAFWLAARASADPDRQMRRWEWLRRPATALWLAVAARAIERAVLRDGIAPESWALALVRGTAQVAVFWAGLDLLGALPGARTFSDRSGPLAGGAFRMPALLPAAGALIFLRQSQPRPLLSTGVDWAQAVLLVAALIAVLRAFGRSSWRRCLRWLVVAECALAAELAAVGTLHPNLVLALWLGAGGGLAVWLVAEHRGAALRRDPRQIHLWRLAGWVSTTALVWPLLVAYVHGVSRQPVMAAGVSLVAGFVAWLMVRRPQMAPERRSMPRLATRAPYTFLAALLTLAIGPATLAFAWRLGYRTTLLAAATALAPAVLGGLLALVHRVPAPRTAARAVAHGLFHTVARGEHQLVVRGTGIGRLLAGPLRDLHTGDAQEYLLFLVGLSVLMLLVPILQ
ncbi:MAG TPA: hypothetical protein VMJ70_01960 [Candidatus Sulfotelmatobacter sp.]|nr:hypothetical protein [Candidatus Sulfotelmatobacter sp.]